LISNGLQLHQEFFNGSGFHKTKKKALKQAKLDWLQNGADGIEELSRLENFSEAIIEEGGNEDLDLPLNCRAMGHAQAIRQGIPTIGTQNRKSAGTHGQSGGILRATTFTEKRSVLDRKETFLKRFRATL